MAVAGRRGDRPSARTVVGSRELDSDAALESGDGGDRVPVAAEGVEVLVAAIDELAARDHERERVGIHRVVVLEGLVEDLLAQREHDRLEVARFLERGECGDARRAGVGAELDGGRGQLVFGATDGCVCAHPLAAAPVEQRDAELDHRADRLASAVVVERDTEAKLGQECTDALGAGEVLCTVARARPAARSRLAATALASS